MDLKGIINREIFSMKENSSLNEETFTLYHGSPYKFDKFSLTNIGSGDGLNKYGYGLYFTDSKEKAAEYANDLSIGDNANDGFNIYQVKVYGDFYNWDEEIPVHLHEQIVKKLIELGHEDDAETMQREYEDYGSTWTMDSLHQILSHILSSPKEVSEFLVDLGVDGVYGKDKVHVGNVYVSFRDDNVKIIQTMKVGDEDEMYEEGYITENVQQLDKELLKTNKITPEDKENILSITNGDNYTFIVGFFYAFLFSPTAPAFDTQEKRNTQFRSSHYNKIFREFYESVKTYNKNVFPIKNYDISLKNIRFIELLSAIQSRQRILSFLRKIPSLYTRNLATDIRIPREESELKYDIEEQIGRIKRGLQIVDRLSDDKKEVIYKKIFSSNNKTFKQVADQLEKLEVLFLNHEDAEDEVRTKVNNLEGEAEILYDANNIMVVDIRSSDAMKTLGCGSQWCFATEYGVDHWYNYAGESSVNIVYNFNEEPDSKTRMVVVLPTGEVYNMYNEYMDGADEEDGWGYLESIGVSDVTNANVVNDSYLAEYSEVGNRFDIDKFDSLPTFSARKKYADQTLERLGSGSARIVYKIDDEKILKLAKNPKGLSQNREECGLGQDNYFNDVVTRVYDCHTDNLWIISEFARKITPAKFRQLVGIDIKYIEMYLRNKEDERRGGKGIYYLEPEIYAQLSENMFVQTLLEMMYAYEVVAGDLGRPSSYGVVIRDGKETVVVSDYGLTRDVYNTHYSKGYVFDHENINEDYFDNESNTNVKTVYDGGYSGFALEPERVGENINTKLVNKKRIKRPIFSIAGLDESLDNYRNVSDTIVKKVTNYVERLSDVIRPKTGKELSKLFRTYLISSQNIERALKFSNNDIEFYNNLIKIQDTLKKFGLLQEDLVYSHVSDATDDSYELMNEEVAGFNKTVADEISLKVAEKLGLSVPYYIGEGGYGYAYQSGDKVIKVTKDQSEAVESLKLKGKKYSRIADIYGVYETEFRTTGDNTLYVIVLEKLNSGNAQQLYFELNKVIDDTEFDTIDDVFNIFVNRSYNEWLETYNDIISRIEDERVKNFFDELIAIAEEARRANVVSKDYLNKYNLGYKKDGKLAFFDVGFGDYFFGNEKPELLHIKESVSMNESNKTTLKDYYKNNYPHQDELIWDFVGPMDYDDTLFDIVDIDPRVIYKEYNGGEIKKTLRYANKDQKDLIKYYTDHIDEAKNGLLVIDSEGKILIDGYHRLIAFILNKVDSVKAIDLSKINEDGTSLYTDAHGTVNESNNRKKYFLRWTNDANQDIERNFSGHMQAWFNTKEEAINDYEQRKKRGEVVLNQPKEDTTTGMWNSDPEWGLSGYAFDDEESYYEAIENVNEIAWHHKDSLNQDLVVFESSDYKLGDGFDGEDVFRNAKIVSYIDLNTSYQDFISNIKSQDSHLNERTDFAEKFKTLKIGDVIQEDEVYQYVQQIHWDYEGAFVDGDLGERIEYYPTYKLQEVSLSSINIEEFDVDHEMVEQYAERIKNTNYYPPIVLGDDYTIIDGTHRANALALLGKKTVLALVGQDINEDNDPLREHKQTKKSGVNENSTDYNKWKRNNVSYRGISSKSELSTPNYAGELLGKGLYSVPASNKQMARQYGKLYILVNARPKNPKIFSSLNEAEIWIQQIIHKISGGDFPDKRVFYEKGHTIEDEVQKLGYDGIFIKGREMVNYKPENVIYFENEQQLRDYYNNVIANSNDSLTEHKTTQKGNVVFFHGTTQDKANKILKDALKASYYEPEWFTLAGQDEIGLAMHHAKSRNKGKTPAIIQVTLPKELVNKYVYREGGLKQPIPSQYLKQLTPDQINNIDNNHNIVYEDRKISYMPDSSTVDVKKKCKLAGNGDGTSTACNQGDMDNLEIKSLGESNERKNPRYGVLMLGLDVPKWKNIISRIKDNDLFGYGRENNPHVTLLYGFKSDVTYETIEPLLSELKPIDIYVKGISIFNSNPEYDVVKFDVELTSELKATREVFEKLPHVKMFDEYRPHITIAYVKAGEGQKYVKEFKNRIRLRSGKFVFQDKNKNRVEYNVTQISDLVESENNNELNESYHDNNIYYHGSTDKIIESNTNEQVENIEENMMVEANILTLNDLPFKEDIEGMGGKIYSVGGAVRDEFLGRESKDLDILITGVPFDHLEELLSHYGKVDAVGKSFGILKFKPHGSIEDIDIAIPRTERATGEGGHKGFEVSSDHNLPIESDLMRRDFTINAIAKDIDGNIIDPFNGQKDLQQKIIRVVNPEAFSDDPLRMLRAVQFAARFGFDIEPKTEQMIRSNASRIKEIPAERILIELEKIVKKGNVLYGADLLRETGLYEQIFGSKSPAEFEKWWDLDSWNHVKTLGEYMFLLMRPVTDKPSSMFKTKLKGDIQTQKEIAAFEAAFSVDSDDPIKNRIIAHNMHVTAPQSLQSNIVSAALKRAIQELNSGKYPKGMKELAVNGNDLMQRGFKGKELGDTLKSLLIKVYSNKLRNNKEELLNSLSVQHP